MIHIPHKMPHFKELIMLFIMSILGSAVGYLLEQNSKRIKTGEPIKFEKASVIMYLVFGLTAATICYFMLTDGRDPRQSDFVISCFAAMKGAEWLQAVSNKFIAKDHYEDKK